ncbi:hypothetical protein NKG94_06960 [Micromonospora sp. M12]
MTVLAVLAPAPRPPGSPRWRRCGRRAPPQAGAASACCGWCSGCS